MGNVRIFTLARDLKLSSQEVVDRLKKLGVEAKTASSSVDEDTADKLRRIMKIDALTAKKSRVYGSDEDEDERDRLEREQRDKVAAERAAREQAAEEARVAAEERRNRSRAARRPSRRSPEGETVPPALAHAPGAPRLAPKVVAPPPLPIEEQEPEEVEDEVPADLPAEAEALPEEAEVHTPPSATIPAAPPPAVSAGRPRSNHGDRRPALRPGEAHRACAASRAPRPRGEGRGSRRESRRAR